MPNQIHTFNYMLDGHVMEVHDYGHEVGNLHVIDWYLYHVAKDLFPARHHNPRTSRIGRYLDGEEEREGLYR